MKLQIYNKIPGHYEIIESIIVKYYIIIGKKSNIDEIYLNVNDKDKSFLEYIKKKYKDIKIGQINNFDYYIDCTIYVKDLDKIIKFNPKKHFFISHEVSPKLNNMENIFYLTPLGKRFLYADIMPYAVNKRMNQNIPVYAIQGHFGGKHCRRRNMNLLLNILKTNFDKKFIIKFIGMGEIPEDFKPYLNKIKFIQNLNFNDYHKQFVDVYAMLPLTLKKTNIQYYERKLTSSINYIRGYKLSAIIDKDLQDIYKLENVYTYTNEKDIIQAFQKSLDNFYQVYKKKDEIINNNEIDDNEKKICEEIKKILSKNNN